MNIGILYYNPDERIKEAFKNIYQALTTEEYRELNQTGIYGKYNTEDDTIEFTIYKVNENKIGIVFVSEKETKVICIDSDKKDYLNDYTHFMIITRSKDFITTLETVKKEDLKKDYRCIIEKRIQPKEKITILFQQSNIIKCTVIKDKVGKIIKTRTWKNMEEAYSEEPKEKLEDTMDKYLENGKQLPIRFKNKVNENRRIIETILKKYYEEQPHKVKREEIEYNINLHPEDSEPSDMSNSIKKH